MDSIGVQLKNARMRKGLSLDEVSGRTRIPARLLQALESDDFSSIDSAFFYRSFATQFAQCVGLDRSVLAEQLSASSEQFPKLLIPGQEGVRTRPDVPGLTPKKIRKMRWVLSIASLAIMLGACSTFYNFWESARSDAAQRVARNLTAPGLAAGTTQSGAGNSFPGVAADALQIKLSAVENTWLMLAADGREVFKGTLRADESRTLEGRLSAQVRTENAGGVEVVFNGRALGRLGPEGQIRTVVFTKDSYNVLHSKLPMALAIFIQGVE